MTVKELKNVLQWADDEDLVTDTNGHSVSGAWRVLRGNRVVIALALKASRRGRRRGVMEEIKNEEQWRRYTLKLDAKYNIYFRHAEPERYPFRVESERRWDDDDGRIAEKDLMYHRFIYQQSVKCEHCGSTTVVWPEGGA